MAGNLTIRSVIDLPSGYAMPQLGLGVFRNDDCKPACLAALQHGYRHIDSAKTYGNEKQVGEAVKESGVPRSEIFITTKITSYYHGYTSTLAAVDHSLAKFQLDYIDLYLIHDPLSGKEKRLETYRALLDCQKVGKIRTVGVSNYSIKHLEEIRKDIVSYCDENGIVLQAYCPLVRGKFNHPLLQKVAKKHAKEMMQVLVRWSLQRGYTPLPKSSQPARVMSNAEVYDFELDNGDMAEIDGLDQGKAGAISWNPVDAY